jgi:hypothetical protein
MKADFLTDTTHKPNSILIKVMGNGASNGRGLTPRYMDVKRQLDATHDLNKALKNNGYSPASGLYEANKKAKQHGLINTPDYNHNQKINHKANKAKHSW